ncbi:MAG: response regulator [Lentimicrobium sp.]|nr:response regulator [Lentimicrobium sp.]
MKPDLKDARILIVDDQNSNIEILESFLTIQGYINLNTVSDSRQAVSVIENWKPDILLLDLMMPHVSGFEIMEQIKTGRAAQSFMPVVVLTADANPQTRQKALTAGASDFLTKPFDLIEVGLRIKNLLFTVFLMSGMEEHNHMLEKKVADRTAELVEKNKELIIARDKAEAADRLKTAFLQNISHEIRTPLNGIIGFASILTDPDTSNQEKEELLPMLNASADRLIKTVTDYMDISMIVSGNKYPVNQSVALKSIFEKLYNSYKDKADAKGLELLMILPAGQENMVISSDAEFLSKSIGQFLDNAIKFTRQGKVEFGYHSENSRVNFYVKDTGCGISEEHTESVFNIFEQESTATTRGYEGSGLGLSISSEMVNMLGGKISLETEKDKGSIFSFSLNVDNQITVAHGDATAVESGQEKTGEVVFLIADDNPEELTFYKYALKQFSNKILLASNGKEALDLYYDNPDVSVVFLDLNMPYMSGTEVAAIIRQKNAAIPILAFSGHLNDEKENTVKISDLFSDMLSKPVTRNDLIRVLANYGISRKCK